MGPRLWCGSIRHRGSTRINLSGVKSQLEGVDQRGDVNVSCVGHQGSIFVRLHCGPEVEPPTVRTAKNSNMPLFRMPTRCGLCFPGHETLVRALGGTLYGCQWTASYGPDRFQGVAARHIMRIRAPRSLEENLKANETQQSGIGQASVKAEFRCCLKSRRTICWCGWMGSIWIFR